jgi:hypothetical protein
MSNYDEVLTHLPQDESNAMTSAQLFNLCKGFDASKDVSTALSQLYKSGKIFRKVSPNGSAGLYIYWNKPQTNVLYESPSLKVVATEKKPTEEITAQAVDETLKPPPAAMPTVCLGSMVDNLIEAIDSTNKTSDAIANLKAGIDEVSKNSALDIQVGGDHYKKLGMYQPWQVLDKWLTPEELKGFAKGTVIAYLAREEDKGGHIDIEKAAHTLQIYLDLVKAKA